MNKVMSLKLQWHFRKMKRNGHKHISRRYSSTPPLSKTSVNSIFWGVCSFRFSSWGNFFLYSCVGNCLVAHFFFRYNMGGGVFFFYFPTTLHKLLHREKYSKYHVKITSDNECSVFVYIKTPKQINQPKLHTTKPSCF